MKKLVLACLFASAPAFADSEFLHQAPDGKIEVSPMINYSNLKAKPKTGTTTTTKGLREGVRAEYGVMDFSFGLDLWMGSLTSSGTPETKQSGLYDPNLFFHGMMPMGSGALKYGVDFGVPLAKAKTERSGDSNFATGQMTATPFVGYQMTSNNCTFGGSLSYKLGLGDGKEEVESATTTTSYTTSGGETLGVSLFYEHAFKPMLLGVALNVESEAKSERKTANVTTESRAPYTNTSLQLYLPYEMSEMITLLPAFTYGQYTAKPSTTDSVNWWVLQVGARFVF